MRRWTIRTRALVLALLPASAVALLLVGAFIGLRFGEIEENLRRRGLGLVQQIAAGSEYGIFSGNREALQILADDMLAETDVRGISLWSGRGELLARAGKVTENAALSIAEAKPAPVREIDSALVFVQAVALAPAASDDPLLPGYTQWTPLPAGWAVVELSRRGTDAARRELLVVGGGIALLVLASALMLAIRMARGISEPLQQVMRAVENIGRGALDVRLAIDGGDDVRRLGQGVNRMAARLETARADILAEIEAATVELREKRAEAEQASIAKTRFLAAASHDLRQPMHALGLFVELLAHKEMPPDAEHLVRRIMQSVEAMGSLLDALLDISRLDAGALVPDSKPLSLQALFERMESDFRAEAEFKGLRFHIRATAAWALSDATLLERVLRNLTANAIRYTARGTVMLAARRRGDRLRIEVRDSGIGIETADQALVFSEFFQVGNPERNREKGLGLGLAIVERLSRLLGHPVGLRSSAGRGSVFWIEVPAASADVSQAAVSEVGAVVDRQVVALIDDDVLVLTAMTELLGSWGCRVYSATSWRRMAELLRDDRASPDLVICDHRLSDGDNGILVVDRLRVEYGAGLPAILLSGDTDPKVRVEAADKGLPILHKPVRPAKLRAALRALIEPRNEASPDL